MSTPQQQRLLNSRLLDIYGCLLPQAQQDRLDEYLNNDLSLAEIGYNDGLTKQGVSDSLNKAIKKLMRFESKFGLIGKLDFLRQRLSQKDFELVQSTIIGDKL